MLEFLLNKAAGLNVCNSIKKRLQHSCFPVKLAKFLKTPFFTEECQWLLLMFNSCFQRSLEQKPGWLSAINTRFRWKKYLHPWKSRSSHRKCSVKEGLQRPAQVLSCEYCKIFKNTYFEKHLWTAASENQGFSDKIIKGRYFLNFIILLIKAFSILNFAMTRCFFLLPQTYCYHKKVHIKWDVDISSSLKLLMNVWIRYRCQNRIENYYYNDGEQLDFYKNIHIKHRAKRKMFW